MFSVIYMNNGEISEVEGLSIASVYTQIMLGHDVVVTIRDNTQYGLGCIGVMRQNMVFRAYWGETFMSWIKLHLD